MTGRLSRNTGPIVELARERSVAIVISASVRFHPRAHIHAGTCVSARGELKKKMRRATRKEEDRQEDAKGKVQGRRERIASESARDNLTTVYRRWCGRSCSLRQFSWRFVKLRARENHAHQGRGHPPFPRGKCTYRLHRRRRRDPVETRRPTLQPG
jgi:hypothetical protein